MKKVIATTILGATSLGLVAQPATGAVETPNDQAFRAVRNALTDTLQPTAR